MTLGLISSRSHLKRYSFGVFEDGRSDKNKNVKKKNSKMSSDCDRPTRSKIA